MSVAQSARRQRTLLLCLHNHQPVGNFDFVLDEVMKGIFKRWMIVKNIHIEIPTNDFGAIDVHIIYDTPNNDKSIKSAVKSYRKLETLENRLLNVSQNFKKGVDMEDVVYKNENNKLAMISKLSDGKYLITDENGVSQIVSGKKEIIVRE